MPAQNDRQQTLTWLIKIADPVLRSGAAGELPANLPSHDWEKLRADFTALEALGRTLAGIAPWLELTDGADEESGLRKQYLQQAAAAISHSVDPASPARLNFERGQQPLVDAAFLAHGLLRSPNRLWGALSTEARGNLISALQATRQISPPETNWLLFSAMVEACLWHFTGTCHLGPIEYAVQKHRAWYLGDGVYGDGPNQHCNYYNSFVIQPMLLQVLDVCASQGHPLADFRDTAIGRAARYAAVLERLISPEATFPVIGRSSAYRMGVFQLLSDMALRRQLPPHLPPAAVRNALTRLTDRVMSAPGTFNADGWLTVGAVGYQLSIRESYIATGSLYLCLTGLLHLGLPASDPFWQAPSEPLTQQKIWAGQDVPADKPLYN